MSRSGRSRQVIHPSLSPGFAPSAVAGLLWLLAGLGAGYWGLQAWGRGPVTPLADTALPAPVGDPAAVARALGAAAAAPAAAAVPVAQSARYRLLGVVARGTRSGVALIAIDGQPPRPFAVGAVLDGGLVLQAVERRGVRLGPAATGPSTVELTLPQAAP